MRFDDISSHALRFAMHILSVWIQNLYENFQLLLDALQSLSSVDAQTKRTIYRNIAFRIFRLPF